MKVLATIKRDFSKTFKTFQISNPQTTDKIGSHSLFRTRNGFVGITNFFINTRGKGNHVATRTNQRARSRLGKYGGYVLAIIIPYYYVGEDGRLAGLDKIGRQIRF